MDELKNPLLWTTIVATLINVALYQINRKTFRLLYEKPKIVIQQISLLPRKPDGMGGRITDTFIELSVMNPSSAPGLIISRKLRRFPFGPILARGDANIQLQPFSRSNMHISLDYTMVIANHKHLAILTLVDIKGRKIRKLFRLVNSAEA